MSNDNVLSVGDNAEDVENTGSFGTFGITTKLMVHTAQSKRGVTQSHFVRLLLLVELPGCSCTEESKCWSLCSNA